MKAKRDPLAQIRQYFEHLEAGDFQEAVKCFSNDVFYSHPPYLREPSGSPRHELQGREALLALLAIRGKRDAHHEYNCYVFGDRGFLSGTSVAPHGIEGSFIAEFTVNSDGLINYYAVYVSVPAVGATRNGP